MRVRSNGLRMVDAIACRVHGCTIWQIAHLSCRQIFTENMSVSSFFQLLLFLFCCLVSRENNNHKVWLLFLTARPMTQAQLAWSPRVLVGCSFIDHSYGLSTKKSAVKSLKMGIHSLKLTASLPLKNDGWKTSPSFWV